MIMDKIMSNFQTYRYLESDSIHAYNRSRFNPASDPPPSNPSGFDRLEKDLPNELADAWERSKGRQGRGSPIWATKLVRARDVEYFLEYHLDGTSARSIAERDGLTTRAVQVAITRGRQILADAIRHDPSLLSLLTEK